MTNKLRPFQIVLISVFAFLALLSIILVRAYRPGGEDAVRGYGDRVVIWGTIDAAAMVETINDISTTDPDFNVVQYQYIDEDSFDDELVNAIAEGRSPDLIVLKADALVKHRAKLLPIPYETISERYFRDTYVDGAEIFTLNQGVYAIPFAVDPLIMYWNRDLFASNGIAEPPRTWETLVSHIVPTLTVRDTSRNITQSAIAFGEYRNVDYGKAVVMSLVMQSGSQMVSETERGYDVGLNTPSVEGGRPPLDAAVQFYTGFSNAASPLYSWNRARASDQSEFVAGDLALYLGLGSEFETLTNKNPNLNFDAAMLPQGADATIKRVYGDFYGFAVPNGSANKVGAYNASLVLASAQYSVPLSERLGMVSPLRSVIARGDANSVRQIMLNSALIARAWLDPDREASDSILGGMIEDVVSNRARVTNAVSDAVRKLSFEY